MFLVLFTAGKRGLLFVGRIVDSLAVANEEEFHDLFVLRDGRSYGVGGLQPWALRGEPSHRETAVLSDLITDQPQTTVTYHQLAPAGTETASWWPDNRYPLNTRSFRPILSVSVIDTGGIVVPSTMSGESTIRPQDRMTADDDFPRQWSRF